MLEAYETFVLALDGTRFDPDVHRMIRKEILEIMDLCQIDTDEVSSIFTYLDPTPLNTSISLQSSSTQSASQPNDPRPQK